MENLTPRQIVAELDKYIIGQSAAKRAVAIALRNRYRRQQLSPELRREVAPKNILMIGPTGVGKTEIARQVARLLDAPFVKVEATRFTEAGYVGQDVETIVFDLVDTAIDLVHEKQMQRVQDRAAGLAKERLVAYLCQQMNGGQSVKRRATARRRSSRAAADSAVATRPPEATPSGAPIERAQVASMLDAAQLDDTLVEIELTVPNYGFDLPGDFGSAYRPDEQDESSDDAPPLAAPTQKRIRRVSVKEARRLLLRDEANKLVDWDEILDEAIERAEQSGVVFVDEIDKIVGPRLGNESDVSGEGVQRDLLPIVEGSTVMTRYGPVKTDHMLFIGAGAFYHHKPSELIPELQGRFPIRVELAALSRDDFRRILVETKNSLLIQAQSLLGTEGVDLQFADEAIERIADIAYRVNEATENIGARRLHTVIERILEEVSFSASDRSGETFVIDAAYVDARVQPLLENEDLARYIL